MIEVWSNGYIRIPKNDKVYKVESEDKEELYKINIETRSKCS